MYVHAFLNAGDGPALQRPPLDTESHTPSPATYIHSYDTFIYVNKSMSFSSFFVRTFSWATRSSVSWMPGIMPLSPQK